MFALDFTKLMFAFYRFTTVQFAADSKAYTYFAIFTQQQLDRNVELSEYECCTVLKVLDTVDNSILSMQSTCMLYTIAGYSCCLLNVFILFVLNANVQIAFCIVKRQQAPCFICYTSHLGSLGKARHRCSASSNNISRWCMWVCIHLKTVHYFPFGKH